MTALRRLLIGSQPAAIAMGVFIALVGVSTVPASAAAPPSCDGLAATIVAVPGVETFGTAAADVIVGSPERDVIRGLDGDDVICGRGGNDIIFGNKGQDTIFGGTGDDRLTGNRGADRVIGGAGNDRIRGSGGDDVLDGGGGHDVLFGGGGDDVVSGGTGDDRLAGNNGADQLRAGTGADRLIGGAGDDVLDGGPGEDECDGGPGIDAVTGCTDTEPPPPPPPPEFDLDVGETLSFAATFGAAPAVIHEFTAAAGLTVVPRLRATEPRCGFGDVIRVGVRLISPTGTVVIDGTAGVGESCANGNPRGHLLPESGTYRLEISPFAGGVTDYEIDLVAPILEEFEAAAGTIAPDDFMGTGAGTLENPGSTDTYRFEVIEGVNFSFEFLAVRDPAGPRPCPNGEGLDAGFDWQLRSPAGAELLRGNATTCDLSRSVNLVEPGIYELTIGPFRSDTSGLGPGLYRSQLNLDPVG